MKAYVDLGRYKDAGRSVTDTRVCGSVRPDSRVCTGIKSSFKKSISAVADEKALSFARTQLCHDVSLLIGSDFIS